MELTLRDYDLHRKVYYYNLSRLKLPTKEVILLNDDILAPILKSRDYRTAFSHSVRENSQDIKKTQVINSIEDGKFKKHNIYPGVTLPVLSSISKKDSEGLVKAWKENNQDHVYFIDTLEKRDNKKLGAVFPDHVDFSVGVASLILGCDIATDGDTCFNNFSLIEFKKMYFDKWGTKSKFKTYNSESLLNLLV